MCVEITYNNTLNLKTVGYTHKLTDSNVIGLYYRSLDTTLKRKNALKLNWYLVATFSLILKINNIAHLGPTRRL